ncbi:hypothetical protein BD560DRAFT_485864 [Blakeslea trispora]|nr:hypothetical protein BD560DRAFT_485864 [Blakeslea trispora]
MLLTLPSELILAVAAYLSKHDYYQLICVNCVCHHLFLPLLYQNMHVSNDNHMELILNRPACHFYVRKLDGYGSTFSKDTIKRITKAFPQLQSFHVGHMRINDPPSFYRSFENLRSLHFILGGGTVVLKDVLSVMPHLESLRIVIRDFLGPHLDVLCPVHRLCPQLKHLALKGNGAEVYESMIQDVSIQPLVSLESFELQVSSGTERTGSWFVFLANQYPNLVKLRLDYPTFDPFEPNRHPAEFYDWFLSKCPRLLRLEWVNVLPDHTLLKKLNRHQLQRQEMVIEKTDLLRQYCDGTGLLYRGLLNLSLSLPRKKASDSFVALIGKACPQLQKLTLSGSSSFVNNLDINAVLDNCLQLTSLYLSTLRLDVEKRELEIEHQKVQRAHPLRRFSLHSSCFHPQSLGYLALRCPELKHMALDKAKQTEEGYQIQLHMPHLQLRELHICELQNRHVLQSGTVQLFHVKQKQKACWYLVDKAKLSSYVNTYSRATSFKTLSKEDDSILDTLLEQDPKTWPEPLSRILTTLVLENRTVLDFLPLGYANISLYSVDALYLNGARAFY